MFRFFFCNFHDFFSSKVTICLSWKSWSGCHNYSWICDNIMLTESGKFSGILKIVAYHQTAFLIFRAILYLAACHSLRYSNNLLVWTMSENLHCKLAYYQFSFFCSYRLQICYFFAFLLWTCTFVITVARNFFFI